MNESLEETDLVQNGDLISPPQSRNTTRFFRKRPKRSSVEGLEENVKQDSMFMKDSQKRSLLLEKHDSVLPNRKVLPLSADKLMENNIHPNEGVKSAKGFNFSDGPWCSSDGLDKKVTKTPIYSPRILRVHLLKYNNGEHNQPGKSSIEKSVEDPVDKTGVCEAGTKTENETSFDNMEQVETENISSTLKNQVNIKIIKSGQESEGTTPDMGAKNTGPENDSTKFPEAKKNFSFEGLQLKFQNSENETKEIASARDSIVFKRRSLSPRKRPSFLQTSNLPPGQQPSQFKTKKSLTGLERENELISLFTENKSHPGFRSKLYSSDPAEEKNINNENKNQINFKDSTQDTTISEKGKSPDLIKAQEHIYPLNGCGSDHQGSQGNHPKKRLCEALEKACYFNDNIIKQYHFQKEAEEEENNFLELCDALKYF